MAFLVRVEQVSALATKAQLDGLFGLCGEVDTLQLFTNPVEMTAQDLAPPRVAFVSFKTEEGAIVASQLQNEPFLERSLSAKRVDEIDFAGLTPADANKGGVDLKQLMQMIANKARPGAAAGMPIMHSMPGIAIGGQTVQVQIGTPMVNSFTKIDVPTPQALDAALKHVDPKKLDEVKRTIYVGNLAPAVTQDVLLNFFKTCGDICHIEIRTAGAANFAFIEFTSMEQAHKALGMNGSSVGDRQIAVKFAKNAVVKAAKPSDEKSNSAMAKMREKLTAMATAADGGEAATEDEGKEKDAGKERSRSRSRDRSRRKGGDRDRDRDRDRSRRDDSRERDRKRDRRRDRDDRDRSRRKDRSRSRDRRRRRSRSGSRE